VTTATSLTSVSLRPPIVSFCVDRESSCRRAMEGASHIAVSLLQEWQEDIARLFARHGADRFGAAR
jgi:flavin reductase (DIM6/NTAB) family NADH-FMN oxidoreductase RutF